MLKKCSKCHEFLSIDCFGRNKRNKDGLNCYCKKCDRLKKKEQRDYYREKNKISKENILERKCYRCGRILSIENFWKCSSKIDGYSNECKECSNKAARERRNDNIRKNEYYCFILRTALKNFIKKGRYNSYGKKSALDIVQELTGCSIDFLKQYIESRFQEGMSWDNYGEWQIDHIIPRSLFDMTDDTQARICFNFRNLQPLWKEDNEKKGDSLIKEWEILRNEITKTILNTH